MAIKFKELKQYISRIVRISVCFEENLKYQNYTLISDIPEGKYDEMYIYGVGMIDVEFPRDVYLRSETEMPDRIRLSDGYFLGSGLEIMVQDHPREDIGRENEDVLKFGDLRDYLQIGENFSVVMREDWSSKEYRWRKNIPQEYNELFVYGIGLEFESKTIEGSALQHMSYDSVLNMRMVIVLSNEPRQDIVK